MNEFLWFDVVRELARKSSDVKETTGRLGPGLKVRGKLLTCPAIHWAKGYGRQARKFRGQTTRTPNS
jgi:hypothetical protein